MYCRSLPTASSSRSAATEGSHRATTRENSSTTSGRCRSATVAACWTMKSSISPSSAAFPSIDRPAALRPCTSASGGGASGLARYSAAARWTASHADPTSSSTSPRPSSCPFHCSARSASSGEVLRRSMKSLSATSTLARSGWPGSVRTPATSASTPAMIFLKTASSTRLGTHQGLSSRIRSRIRSRLSSITLPISLSASFSNT